MISKSHFLLALALAAVTAPVALGGNGGYPQLRTGEGFSFKAPSYWSSTQRTAAPAPVNAMNRSLGVPARYQVHDAPVTTAASARPKVDPLAVGYLIGQGLSPSQVTSWTVGACSQEIKAASCYAMLRVRTEPKVFSLGTALAEYAQKLKRTATPKVDPFAVSYLIGQGLTASQVTSWTVGACSHQTKAPACYAMLEPASTYSPQVAGSTGFQWGDAGIGAGFALGIVLLLAGAGAGLLISRRNGRHQAARA